MSQPHKYSVFSSKYQNDLKGMIRFELTSYLGRIFWNKKPKLTGGTSLLHAGCGDHKFEGWVNADFYQGLRFWKKYPGKPDWLLDFRYPLNCDSNIWDGIFCEHTLEHLYPLQALNLLEEFNRTLKPKAWIRITVPDLRKYVDYYNGKLPHENFLRWNTGCEAIRSLTQNWSHLSVWDSCLLAQFFKKADFVNIKEVEYRKGTDNRLFRELPQRKWETLYIEAQKQ